MVRYEIDGVLTDAGAARQEEEAIRARLQTLDAQRQELEQAVTARRGDVEQGHGRGETLAAEIRFGASTSMKEAEVGAVKVRIGVAKLEGRG